MGIALYRAVQNLARKHKENVFLSDMIQAVELDGRVQDRTREALLNRLEMAVAWNLFSECYQEAQG